MLDKLRAEFLFFLSALILSILLILVTLPSVFPQNAQVLALSLYFGGLVFYPMELAGIGLLALGIWRWTR